MFRDSATLFAAGNSYSSEDDQTAGNLGWTQGLSQYHPCDNRGHNGLNQQGEGRECCGQPAEGVGYEGLAGDLADPGKTAKDCPSHQCGWYELSFESQRKR